MEAFPKVFQVIRDLFFRQPDGGGDILCRKRAFLQEGADLLPYGFRKYRPCFRTPGFADHNVRILPGEDVEFEEPPIRVLVDIGGRKDLDKA